MIQINIFLIRHGKTKGNLEKKYIGVTDESLCSDGTELLKKTVTKNYYPESEIIFSSPLKRCIETAKIIYPNFAPIVFDDLREINFGEFENKSYEELKIFTTYKNWIDSMGTIDIPSGERKKDFEMRCQKVFLEIISTSKKLNKENISIITHGGVIMEVMRFYNNEKKSFYDFQIKNGEFLSIKI